MNEWLRRLLQVGLAVLIITAAVSCSLREKNQNPVAIIHTTLPEKLQTETAQGGSAQVPPPSGNGILALTIRDQSGRGPEGIPVSIDGPMQDVQTTDPGGQLRMDLRAGFYAVAVMEGCMERLQVLVGGSAQLAIVAGQTTQGELATEWRHRIAPSGPVHSSVTPYWPVGKEIALRYNVIDRCKDEARAPNGSFPTYRFHHDDSVEIVGSPQMSADNNGFAHVTVTCRREGTPRLTLVDEANPDDALDLPRNDTSSGTPPECRNT